jgi:hypothetical protein
MGEEKETCGNLDADRRGEGWPVQWLQVHECDGSRDPHPGWFDESNECQDDDGQEDEYGGSLPGVLRVLFEQELPDRASGETGSDEHRPDSEGQAEVQEVHAEAQTPPEWWASECADGEPE